MCSECHEAEACHPDGGWFGDGDKGGGGREGAEVVNGETATSGKRDHVGGFVEAVERLEKIDEGGRRGCLRVEGRGDPGKGVEEEGRAGGGDETGGIGAEMIGRIEDDDVEVHVFETYVRHAGKGSMAGDVEGELGRPKIAGPRRRIDVIRRIEDGVKREGCISPRAVPFKVVVGPNSPVTLRERFEAASAGANAAPVSTMTRAKQGIRESFMATC